MVYVRKFLSNYAILVIGDLVSRLLALWAMVHIARVLGKDLFGILGFATAFTAYFELISRQGLDLYGIQAVAREPALARRYADVLLGLRLTASIAAFSALSLVVWRLAKPEEVKLLIVLSGLMFFTAAFSPQWVFQALEEMRFAATARILSTSIFTLLVLGLMQSSGQLLWVPLFQFGSEATAVVWLLLVFRRRYGILRPAFDLAAWKRILRESVPMGLEGVFGVVMFNFDMVMLGFWRPASEVGVYSAAYKFINFASAFIFLYGSNLLPLLSRSRVNPNELGRVASASFKFTLLITVPLAAGGAMLARGLIDRIFGSQFSAAAGALQILIWVIPFVTCRVVLRNALLSHGLQRSLLWSTFCAAAINAGLNLLLIPHYSYIGSASAMVITEGLLLLLLYRQVSHRIAPLSLAQHIWKPVMACIPMALLLAWRPAASLIAHIAFGALAYILAAWVIRAFTVREIIKMIRPGRTLQNETRLPS